MTQESKDLSEFERALQESLGEETFDVGSVTKGTIVAIHGDVALVDIGGKSEAILERAELDDLGVGEPVEVVIVSAGDELRVSRRLALQQRVRDQLQEAAGRSEPVEGKVVGRRKGGFDVTVGGIRGFCPASHISVFRSENLDEHLGQTYTFRVLEYDPDQDKLVLSRAAHLREEREKQRQEVWERLEVGGILEGRVRSLTNFGAFVDLGGVDGLVHVTEISHRRIPNASDVLEEGQTVTVKVLELDRERDRVSLSIKALEPDPWDGVTERFPSGGPFTGTVVRKAEFGAFVELEPGIDGLLHISQLPPGMELDAPELEVGEELSGWVRDLDVDKQRVALTLRQVPDKDPWQRVDMRYQEGQLVEGVVEGGRDFGVFVELEPGISALIPASELGMGRDVDPAKALRPGSAVTAKVLSVDGEKRRISLSIRGYKRDKERQEYLQHMGSASSGEPSTTTGFGQQLMDALGQKKK